MLSCEQGMGLFHYYQTLGSPKGQVARSLCLVLIFVFLALLPTCIIWHCGPQKIGLYHRGHRVTPVRSTKLFKDLLTPLGYLSALEAKSGYLSALEAKSGLWRGLVSNHWILRCLCSALGAPCWLNWIETCSWAACFAAVCRPQSIPKSYYPWWGGAYWQAEPSVNSSMYGCECPASFWLHPRQIHVTERPSLPLYLPLPLTGLQ